MRPRKANMNLTRIDVHPKFRRVTNLVWSALGLTVLALLADVAKWDAGFGVVGRGALIATLFALALIIVVRVRMRSVLAQNDAGFEMLFQDHPQPILIADNATLAIVAANNAAIQKYGYSKGEFATLTVFDLHRLEDRDEVRSAWFEMGDATEKTQSIGPHVAKNGEIFDAEVMSTTFLLDERVVRMKVVTDVTDRDRAQAESLESDARYRQIVATAKEGIVTVDTDLAISALNPQASEMLGYEAGEVVDPRVSKFSAADEDAPKNPEMGQPGDEGVTGEREMTVRRKDGTLASFLLNESPLVDNEGNYAGQLGMMTDLTERNDFENELTFQASHDPLTGLPNRLLLVDRLQRALRATSGGRGIAVLLVDIDRFGDVNTIHGIAGGDQVLVEIASRLLNRVGEKETVARFGGDEFVIVSAGSGRFAEELAEKVRAAITAPCSVGDTQIRVTASIGVAQGTQGDNPGALLRGADMALLQAKVNGPDRAEFFSEKLHASSRQRLSILSDLQQAIERSEFSLRFQPVVTLKDTQIIGAEALIRWEHPKLGTLEPPDFIPLAEESGLIDSIGQWVIEEACRRAAAWQQIAPDLSMALNISARQLHAGTLQDMFREAIKSSGVQPFHLALEITERVVMDDVEISIETLTGLREMGMRISMDDFGIGYSSLSYLNRFPIDILKIDQSFIAGLPEDPYATALVQAVLAIAESLKLSVVAEGVENQSQAETLLRLGCPEAQGFYFYRPLTGDDFETHLRASRSNGAAARANLQLERVP